MNEKNLSIVLSAVTLLIILAACGSEASESEPVLNEPEVSTQVSETPEPTQKPKRTPPPKPTRTPTPKPQEVLVSAYKDLGNRDYIPYYLNNNAERFMTAHSEMFPMLNQTYDVTINDALVDNDFDSREMNKNTSKFGNKLICLNNVYLNEIYEYEWTYELNQYGWKRTIYLTELYVIDQDEQYYYVLYLGNPLDGFLMGDQVDVYGLPLDTSYYSNVSGGETKVIVIAGAKIDKY